MRLSDYQWAKDRKIIEHSALYGEPYQSGETMDSEQLIELKELAKRMGLAIREAHGKCGWFVMKWNDASLMFEDLAYTGTETVLAEDLSTRLLDLAHDIEISQKKYRAELRSLYEILGETWVEQPTNPMIVAARKKAKKMVKEVSGIRNGNHVTFLDGEVGPTPSEWTAQSPSETLSEVQKSLSDRFQIIWGAGQTITIRDRQTGKSAASTYDYLPGGYRFAERFVADALGMTEYKRIREFIESSATV